MRIRCICVMECAFCGHTNKPLNSLRPGAFCKALGRGQEPITEFEFRHASQAPKVSYLLPDRQQLLDHRPHRNSLC